MKQNLSKRRVVSAGSRKREDTPAGPRPGFVSVATYFPGPAEQPENSLLGPPDVVDHVVVRMGHVVGKHIVLATKCTSENGQLFWTL